MIQTATGTIRSIAPTIALTMLFATSAVALDTRQPDGGGVLHSDLVRAFVPCTSPNTVTSSGQPACAPAITSSCTYPDGSSVDVSGRDDFTPAIQVNLSLAAGSNQPPACLTEDDYVGSIELRGSADDTDDLLEAPCVTGRCTYPDDESTEHGFFFTAIIGGQVVMTDGNHEFLGFTLTAPDGLPMAAPGVGRAAPAAERFVSNLTLPTPPCVGPRPCDLPPLASPCDFDSGEVEWTLDASGAPRAHVTLRNVVGTSPVCTSGTYTMEALVRATVRGCGGTAQNPGRCTLVDQTVTLPLERKGRDVDDGGLVQVGGFAGVYDSAQILAVRVLDPTGVPVAAAGVTGVETIRQPRIAIKGDQLRIEGFISAPAVGGSVLDPATAPGLRVALRDRNGTVYAVTIPEERWQLQPPVGSRWDYTDQFGTLNGVRAARVTRILTRGVQSGYKVELKARGVDLSTVSFPALTLQFDVHRFIPASSYDDVFRVQGTRTCRGAFPKLTCK